MAEPVTQKDFELFKQEMKSDYALFKQEIRTEIKSAKESIAKEVNDFIGKKLNFLIGVVIIFILAYAAYFEWTHNSINEINHQRASLRLEESILAVLNKKLVQHGVELAGEKPLGDKDKKNLSEQRKNNPRGKK